MELADKLQGIDYTYTADGKLKAINHANVASDPGKDGTGNSFAGDVFGMNVEYHPNDYVRSGSGIASIQNASYPAHYNGNINGISWSSRKPSSVTGQDGLVMNAYKYDAKYQLTNNGWGTPNFSTNAYTETANVNKEHGITYDANGNILTLKRNNPSGTTTANYTYTYTANTDKLASVSGYASYTYDAIGRLASETKGSQSSYLEYDVTGKVTKIYSNAAKTQLKLSFVYDESGKRIKKQDHSNNNITWYVYDGSGQLAAVYDNGDGTMKLREQPVYAGSRVGIYFKQANNYQYQLSDHLGNVRVVINRNKLSNGNADVVFYADYYPFGTVVRSGGTGWRYGYQGEYAEKDGETGWNSFELRNYDAAIGRWLTTDPYGQYASPYVGMGNNPVNGVDPDGGYANPVGAFFAWVAGGFKGTIGRDRSGGSHNGEWMITTRGKYVGEGAGVTYNVDYGLSRREYEASKLGEMIEIPFRSYPEMGYEPGLVDANWVIDIGVGLGTSAARYLGTRLTINAVNEVPWARVSGIVRDATKGKGNFGLGSGTIDEAMTAGKSWVGDGFKIASDGKTMISADGLRQFRPPSFKPRLGKTQANFEWRNASQGQWQGNGHLTIIAK